MGAKFIFGHERQSLKRPSTWFTLYSVRMGERIMSLFISLNSFQSSSRVSMSRNSGSNLGPPGMHMFKLLAVTNAYTWAT